MIGKVSPAVLADLVFSRTGAPDERVRQGPAAGEDAAAIELGDGYLVVSPDPISMAVGRIGTLGVPVAANDVAACGATPEWLTSTIFLPESDGDALDAITAQLDAAASRLGVSIVAGHTEYAPSLDTPLLVVTCLGVADRYIPTGGLQPGDRLLVTTGAGIEATAILATDFRELVAGQVPAGVIDAGVTYAEDISVLPEARALTETATAMHDPTEGGLLNGLVEMARAAGVRLDVDAAAIPVGAETGELCRAAGVDPLRVFGSGALLAGVPPESVDDAVAALQQLEVTHAVVGTAHETSDPAVVLDGEPYEEAIRDEMYALWTDDVA